MKLMPLIVVAAMMMGSHYALAANAAPNTLEELSQKVSALEHKIQDADENAGNKAKNATGVTSGKDGFAITSADQAFQLRMRGLIQVDDRFYLDDSQDKFSDTFLLRKVRPIFDVKMYDDFAIRIMPEFAGSSPSILDSYLDFLAMPAFNLRVGKFKTPFGLELLQTDSEGFFAEKGLPTQLAPARDVGLQASGSVASGTVTYAVGVFNGTVDGGSTDADNNDEKDFAARLFLHPFRMTGIESLQNLGIGMAATFGNEQGTMSAPNLPSLKTSGQQTFFSYKSSTNANGTAFANGQHIRLGPQAYYYAGPFGLLTEYVKSSQDISNGKNAVTLDTTAWQIQAGWVVTGEKAGYTDVKPRTDFAPSKGTWGALELVGRYGELTVDDQTFSAFADSSKSATAAKTWAVGMNWYLNRSVKLMLDYDQTSFDGGAAKGTDRPSEELLLARAQFSF